MTNKQRQKIDKAIYLLNLLTDNQEIKLWIDYKKYYDNTVEPQLKKIDSMLASGYYAYNTTTYKWLRKYKFKLLDKNNHYNFIINNAFKYMKL